MAEERLTILVVEDNAGDFIIIQQMLFEIREFSKDIVHETTLAGSINALNKQKIDVILLDLSLSDSYGIDSFLRLKQVSPQIPILILSGLNDMRFAHDAVKSGAQDYLVKGEFDDKLLAKSILYSIERNNNRELLRQSEESYKLLFENNPIPMFIREKDTFKILKVNQSASRVFGYTEDEFLSMTLLQMHPSEEHAILKSQDKVASDDPDASQVFRFLKRNGNLVFVELKKREVVFEDRPAILVMADDITEKRKVQEEIFTQANILKNVQDTIFVTDSNGFITYWNEGAEKTFGYSREEMIGRTYEILYSEFEKFTFHLELNEILSGNLQQWESKLITADDKIIWLDNKASLISQAPHGITGYIRVCKDITQRKRFAEKQKETVATLNSIFNNVIQSIILLDEHGRIKASNVTANRQFIQLMGKELLENQDFLPYLIDSLKPTFTAEFERALTGELAQYEMKFHFSEKSVHWFAAGLSPVADDSGFVLGVCVSMINITERKISDEKFKGQYLEIEHTNKELDKLVKILSHDLRAPMNSVKGLIEIARNEQDPEQFGTYLNMMEKSVKKLEDFTHDIIHSLKDRGLSANRKFNLAFLVSEILDELRFASGARDIRFENEIPAELLLNSNPTQVRIILSNLISNAIKYHDPQKGANKFVKITAEKKDGQLIISIQDNGIGIPEEFHGRIFDSYFTVGTHVNSNGLGLSNVKEAVSLLKGTITLHSKEGEGSIFFVTLPG